MYYRLNEAHEPVECTIEEWGALYKDFEANHRVAKTKVGDLEVSTVFLALEHVGGMFETLVFGDDDAGEQMQRYETWEEAVAGHRSMVHKLRLLLLDP